MSPTRRVSEICNAILTAMKDAGNPLSAGEIARIISYPESRVATSISHLVEMGKVQSPRTSYFSVTDPSAIGRSSKIKRS